MDSMVGTWWFKLGRFLLLAFSLPIVTEASSDSCTEYEEEIVKLVHDGALSTARWVALTSLSHAPDCEAVITKVYREAADEKLQNDVYIRHLQVTSKRPRAKPDSSDCSFGDEDSKDASDQWDKCCSILPQAQESIGAGAVFEKDANNCWNSHRCCEFFSGSNSHLRLPALLEPALRVRIPWANHSETSKTMVLELEQDAFLRPFDPAGIFWPSGYLLTLCVANPQACQAPELVRALDSSGAAPVAIELGIGVGAPSIALALQLQDRFFDAPAVVATDVAPHALALTSTNAKANGAKLLVERLNHTDIHSLEAIKIQHTRQGFAVVMGSSLQSLFQSTENPDNPLWSVLDVLMDRHNPHAIAVLVHTSSDPLQAPSNNRFTLLRRVSGDEFGMQTRSGESSDFELSFFRRSTQTDEL
jgi:hypothetical protein